jgi:FlaA1/EpsC-like NDP-sugar epimerase
VFPVRPNLVRNRYLLLTDAVLLVAIVFLGFAIRLERLDWSDGMVQAAIAFAALTVPLKLAVFHRFGLYGRLWAYATGRDLEVIVVAALVAGLLAFPIGAFAIPVLGLAPVRVPLSVLVSTSILGILVAAGPRWAIRAAFLRRQPRRRRREDLKRALVVGAGRAGQMVVRELERNGELAFEPVGFLDDDRFKQGLHLAGLPVLGGIADLPRIVEQQRVAKVIIAMPTAPGSKIREVVDASRAAGVRVRTMPGLFELISGRKSVSALRDVRIEDLLRREPVETDMARVSLLARERTVLVTGAGGSIGGELCRQLAELGPTRLVLLGHGENSIFHIHNELFARFPNVELVPLICDIRDRDRLATVMRRYRPWAVFHAAAHKHVPLMEFNLHEAVTNNVLGTRNVAETAAEAGAQHFVLISSDKAVRPTNVMGATKRVAEQVVQEIAERHGRNFVAVRFGNVLGSRGSVVPTFLEQIRAGGPITITHPDMTRYFMTIPEAVQLVLQAAVLGSGRGGEVFVLDMGEPVKIVDLATDLIRLSGLEVGGDVEIRFTGMRPGEKLYEELFFNSEAAAPTEHPKVLCARNAQREAASVEWAESLIAAARAGEDAEALRERLRTLVPDFVSEGKPARRAGRSSGERQSLAGAA